MNDHHIVTAFDHELKEISRILAEVTDPIIAPLRRVIPPIGMIDVSFIVAIILIQVLQNLLRQALRY